MRRDFPTPASPTTVTRRLRPAPTASRSDLSSTASSSARPIIGASRRRGRSLLPRTRDEAVRGNALGLALQLERLDRLHVDVVADEAVREVSEEHLVLAGRLLEAGGDVHGVAGDEPLAGGRVARDDLARVHAGAVGEADAPGALELLVQLLERSLHPGRGAYRAHGVVLVEHREAEDGHHGVADELLDHAAVPLELGAHRVEVARHHLAQRLRVEPLAHARRALEVGEDDRHDLPHLLWGRRRGTER